VTKRYKKNNLLLQMAAAEYGQAIQARIANSNNTKYGIA
jgi:hypothetical protein